jgi:hypothetical protein
MARIEGVSEARAPWWVRMAYRFARRTLGKVPEPVTTQTPVEVGAPLFATLRQHFDDAQLVELTAAIAWENDRARCDHALDIGAQGFSEGAFCVLPERLRRALSRHPVVARR